MSELEGRPDFGAPIDGGPAPMFGVYGSTTDVRVLPDELAVAMLPDQRPDFRLDIVRSALATGGGRSSLRLGIDMRCPLEGAIAAARERVPGATVAAARAARGFARLVSAGRDIELPPELAAPQPIDWTNRDVARFAVAPLGLASVEIVKGALLKTTLLLWARFELEIPGVADRLATRARFEPRKLLGPIVDPKTRTIAWDDLVAALSRGGLPLTLAPAIPIAARTLGNALADRVRAAWGKLVPSADGTSPTIEFPADAALPDQVDWDLSTPLVAYRPIALHLDPLAAAQKLAQTGELARLVVERTDLVLPVGTWRIAASANLPRPREHVIAAGATLRVPAHPPARPQDIVHSIDFDATDQGTAQLQLAPREPLAYSCVPFVVLEVDGRTRRIEGGPRAETEPTFELGPTDFGVTFVPVFATPGVLAEATLAGTLHFTVAGSPVDVTFTLTPATPRTALAIPPDASDATITVVATPLTATAPITLGPFPTDPLEIGLTAFPQYGPQRVAITAGDTTTEVAVDLAPVCDPDRVTTLRVASPTQWTYVATSPFQGGYRYRVRDAHGNPAAWSEPRDPGPLEITPPAPAGRAFQLDGVDLFTSPDEPNITRYLPPAPIAARAPNGSPLVAVYDLGPDRAIWQLSVRFDLDDALRDKLRADLPAGMLQPVAIHVDQVTAELDGAVLATSTASGFPPWDAIFSIPVTGAQAARVRRALQGESGIATVTVHATVPPSIAVLGTPSSLARTADVSTMTRSAT